MKILARVALLVLLLIGAAQAEVVVPSLSQRVTDLTATLDARQIQTLESRLAAFEAKNGAQLAVLIVPTTQPETIEQFSMRVVETWKLGRKGVDDGALLLVAKNDRTIRIEVGYGLEGALPDAIAKRIIAEIISPRFKQGDFFGGISVGVEKIMSVIDGESLPPQQKLSTEKYQLSDLVKNYLMWIFLGSVISGLVLTISLGNFPGGLVNSVLVGSVVGLLGSGLIPVLIVVVLVFVMTVSLFRSRSSGGNWDGGGGSSVGGGFSSSGSNFSGGGGDFGGGGASGSW